MFFNKQNKIYSDYTLDSVLKSLIDTSKDYPLPKDVIYLNIGILHKLEDRDKLSIVNKLLKDGYINVIFDEIGLDKYYINFDGIMFIDNGGYKNKRKLKNEDKYLKIFTFIFLTLTTISGIYYVYHEVTKKDDSKLPSKHKLIEVTEEYNNQKAEIIIHIYQNSNPQKEGIKQ